MRVSGFSIARNAVEYGYPIVEAVSSILPLCDEVVVNVGVTDDGTLGLVRSIPSRKVKIIEREWDMSMQYGGRLISTESNHALELCRGDWCFYIQADEVIHEKFHPVVQATMAEFLDDPRAEALQFRYRHFYGSYDYYQDNNRRWYTKESRIIKRHPDIVSWGDGMDFRHKDGSKLSFKRVDAEIYHYGWARPPATMVTKQAAFLSLYGSGHELTKTKPETIYTDLGHLKRFKGSHPSVMKKRIAESSWEFDPEIEKQPPDWIRHISLFFLPLTKRIRKLNQKVRSLFGTDRV